MDYQIGLCNVWWSKDDIDTRFFSDRDEQKTYFENKIDGRWSTPVNFTMRNNINPTITYTDETGQTIYNVLRNNYCVIKYHFISLQASYWIYRFFFINNITHTGGKTYSIDLELDDIQTNYFYNYVRENLPHTLINRAHINRFADFNLTDTSVKYDTTDNANNHSMYGEPTATPNLKLLSRQKLKLCVDSKSTVDTLEPIDSWLNDNVIGWEYYYFANDEQPTLYESKSSYTAEDSYRYDELAGTKGALSCYCVPVFKNNRDNDTLVVQRTSTDNPYYINRKSMEEYIRVNNLSSYIYARKFSIKPPFAYDDYTYNTDGITPYTYTTGAGTLTWYAIPGTTPKKNFSFKIFTVNYSDDGETSTRYYGVIKVDIDRATPIKSLNNVVDNYTYDKTTVENAPESKLYDTPFRKYVIRRGGDTFEYSPLKTNGVVNLEYTESLTPDITRYYACIVSPEWYGVGSNNNLTGLVGSMDTSLMVSNDKLAEMLAYNKNYYMQNNASWGMQALQSVGSIFSGNIIGGIMGLANTGLDIWQQGMTRDNLRSAPNTIKNANGDTCFNSAIADDGIYLEVYGLTNVDSVSVNDKIKEYGYNLGIIGQPKNFDNIRKYYNYLSVDVSSIVGSFSNTEKTRLKERLRSVRFWNIDPTNPGIDIYQDYNNIERSIDEWLQQN